MSEDVWYVGRPPGTNFVRDESYHSWNHNAVWDNGAMTPMWDSLKKAIVHFRLSREAYEIWAIRFDLMSNAYLDGFTGIAVINHKICIQADMSDLVAAVFAATDGEESWFD